MQSISLFPLSLNKYKYVTDTCTQIIFFVTHWPLRRITSYVTELIRMNFTQQFRHKPFNVLFIQNLSVDFKQEESLEHSIKHISTYIDIFSLK